MFCLRCWHLNNTKENYEPRFTLQYCAPCCVQWLNCMNRISISKTFARDNWLNIVGVKPGYTVKHCVQCSAQLFLLNVARRSRHFVKGCAQYLMKSCETYDGRLLDQRLNLKFDWLNTEVCVTSLHEMLQMMDTKRNLLHAMLQKKDEILLLQHCVRCFRQQIFRGG